MSVAERVLVIALIVAVCVAIVGWTLWSLRRGGLGPPMKVPPLTRAGRRRVNATYAKHGWAKPFDEDGNLLPAGERERERPHPD